MSAEQPQPDVTFQVRFKAFARLLGVGFVRQKFKKRSIRAPEGQNKGQKIKRVSKTWRKKNARKL